MLNNKYNYLLAAVILLSAGSAGITGALLITGHISGGSMWVMLLGEIGLMSWALATRLHQQKANAEYLTKLESKSGSAPNQRNPTSQHHMNASEGVVFPHDKYKYLLAAVILLSAGSAGVTCGLLISGVVAGAFMWLMLIGELGVMSWALATRLRQQKANAEYLRQLG